jgi:putative transposase
MRSTFTEEKIIAVLAKQERRMTTAEVCRKHGISSATFYIYGLRPSGKKVVIVV